MTGDRDPIQQYLDQLRLSLRIPEVGRILVEAEDHLRAATAAGMAEGLTERAAQQAAIAGFGPVRAIVYAHQTRHGRAAAVLADLAIALWRVAAFYLLAAFLLGLVGLLRPGSGCPARAASCKLFTLVPETSALAALISWAATGVSRPGPARGILCRPPGPAAPWPGMVGAAWRLLPAGGGRRVRRRWCRTAAAVYNSPRRVRAVVRHHHLRGGGPGGHLWIADVADALEPGARPGRAGMTAGIPGRQFLYRLYARRLRRQLAGGPLPRHVGIIMDGNRRWARQQGLADPSLGHQYGADHVEDVLGWCEKAGIRHVTVFVCSAENLTGRERRRGRLTSCRSSSRSSPTSSAATPDLAGAHRRRPRRAAGHHRAGRSRRPSRQAATARQARTSPWPSATAAGRKSSTRSAPCCTSTPTAGTTLAELAETPSPPRTSPAISTPPASPIPTWSSAPAASSATVQLPALAERLLRAVLLRGLLARVPGDRLSRAHCAASPRRQRRYGR